MDKQVKYDEINANKTNFDELYTKTDPRDYYKYLGQLDYIIPHLAQRVFNQVIRARSERQTGPVTVLDLGSSYGVNGALMKYDLTYDALRQRYIAPAVQLLSSDELLKLDRNFFNAWPKRSHVRVIALDRSENAVSYAQACGTADLGLAIDLESRDPTPQEAEILAQVDIIVSTGCVGYVTSKTFERIAALARTGRPAWAVSFVLRMFPFDKIAATLARFGLMTEKFEGATFVQRRFADQAEMEATVTSVEARGIDTRGHEADGLYHADLYVSRQQSEIDRLPLQKLVSVVSGANKPWPVGTNVLGAFGETARRRARAKRTRPNAAPAPSPSAGLQV